MSLWTPDGEIPVERSGRATPPLSAEDLTPEEEAELQQIAGEMSEVRRQVAEAPPEVIVANHAMGLYELAAIHLTQQPPNFDSARLAVDAFTGILERCRGRLGDSESTLRDALAQIQLAFAQLLSSAEAATTDPDS